MITNRFFLPLLLVMFTPVAAWAIDNDSISIEFEDAAVKELCVENWDTDGDGELSYAEAAAVIDLGDVFSSKGNIYKFHELQYFTGLDSINSGAFSYSYNLNEITFPSNIKSIGDYAFVSCYRIYSLTFPEGLIRIGNHAFEDVYYYLTSLTLPSTLTTLGDFAFDDCHEITSVTVKNPTPAPITYDTFNGVYGKATLYVPAGSKQAYSEADGWKNFASIEEFVDTTNIAFADPTVKSICVEKWDTDGDGELSYEEAAAVTDISQTFWVKEITSFDELQYFTGLQSSGSWAFYNDKQLASIKLPENLTSIDDYFLCNCENLSSLEIPQNVSSIGIDAIKGCKSLKELIFPDGLKSFATSSIAECTSLESVQFPNSLTFIGDHAFHGCSSLSSIFIPRSVEQFGEAPFVYCNSVESISVDADNPHFDSRNNCNAVIRKEDNALILGCKNTIIPSTVRKIVLGAFAGHSDLQSITLNHYCPVKVD